jgi:excisionase family DNA binding protein
MGETLELAAAGERRGPKGLHGVLMFKSSEVPKAPHMTSDTPLDHAKECPVMTDEHRRDAAASRRQTNHLPDDVRPLTWAAEQLGISKNTAYRLAERGELPGVFRVGVQYRVSVPRFFREVHGEDGA